MKGGPDGKVEEKKWKGKVGGKSKAGVDSAVSIVSNISKSKERWRYMRRGPRGSGVTRVQITPSTHTPALEAQSRTIICDSSVNDTRLKYKIIRDTC